MEYSIAEDGDKKPYHRYTDQERAVLIERMVEMKFRSRKSWDEVCDEVGVSRATSRRWRMTDEWRMVEARWRRILREEARSDVHQIAHDAIGVLQDLMHDASVSPFTRYNCAAKLVDLVGIEDEIEERKADQNDELLDFLKKVGRKSNSGSLPPNPMGEILDIEVKPGGLLPDEIVEENMKMLEEFLAQDALANDDTIDGEFRYTDDESDEDSLEHEDASSETPEDGATATG